MMVNNAQHTYLFRPRIILVFPAVALMALWAVPAGFAAGLSGSIQQVESIMREGNYDRALESARELETEYPDDPLPAYCAGMACYRKGRQQESADAKEEAAGSYAEAARFFSQAASRKTDDMKLKREILFAAAAAQTCRGTVLGDLERYDEAAAAMRDALRLYELTDQDPRVEKGRTYAAVKLREYLSKTREKQQQQQQKNQQSPEQAGLIMEAVTELPRKQVVVDKNAAVLQDQTDAAHGTQ